MAAQASYWWFNTPNMLILTLAADGMYFPGVWVTPRVKRLSEAFGTLFHFEGNNST
jgi:hypothetical protein